MKHYVIIVAGGSGSRMQSSTPKQFLPLNQKPILLHTLERLYASVNQAELIIALPSSQFDVWKTICEEYQVNIPHQLCCGGTTRFESVKNALKMVSETSIIAIHDGVRPLVKKSVVKQCLQTAQQKGAAIPVLRIEESIRKKMKDEKSTIVNRDDYLIVQTPQCFKSSILLEAYQQAYSTTFTDDASVVETMGNAISLVDGNKENIKITRPEDLIIAESFLKQFDELDC